MYQKLIVIGRLGQKELKTSQAGSSYCNFSVATTKSHKDESGQWSDSTEWHRCIGFGKCAEHINNNFNPGDVLQLEGELQTRKWTDNAGTDHYTTEVIVNDFPKKLPRFFTKDGQSAGANPQNQQQPQHQQGQPQQQAQPQYQQQNQQGYYPQDDIPA